MSARLPLIADFEPHAVLVWNGAQPVTQRAFIAQAQALAERLPEQRYALNLCEDRYRFMLAFCAAVLRGQTNLLPPSTAPAVLAQMQQQYPQQHVLDDATVVPDNVDNVTTVPQIADIHLAALVMTSGSTGTPRVHPKRWDTLVRTAALSRAALLPNLDRPQLIATVPPQHMFGLETTVFYALAVSCTTHAARPFFPADIRDALAAVPAPRVLITTPLHLRALLHANMTLPPLALILSATAPLARELAQAAEQRFDVAVREIYGCTEAGSLATRRLTQSPQWTLHEGTRLAMHDDQSTIHAAHLPEPLALDDRLQADDERRFHLLGRSTDLLKVAGKRASLAELTQHLLRITGVEDAVVFVPEGQERPAALVVAATLSEAQILSALAPHIDAVFLPRPLKRVAQLPRSAVGKLSHAILIELLAS